MAEMEITHWVELAPGTKFVRFDAIAPLVAAALWPEEQEDGDDAVSVRALQYGGTRINLEEELSAAVKGGRLAVLDPLSRGPHTFPVGAMLHDAIVAVSELRKYFASRQIGIRMWAGTPHFVITARIKSIPFELADLAPDSRVTFEHYVGIQGSNGTTNAADCRAAFQEVINRQSEDLFTVDEAAQLLADARHGRTASKWVEDIYAAHRSGVLAVRDNVSRIPFRPARPAINAVIPSFWTAEQDMTRHFMDLVRGTDVDSWLRVTAGYGFPTDDRASPKAHADALGLGNGADYHLIDVIATAVAERMPGDYLRRYAVARQVAADLTHAIRAGELNAFRPGEAGSPIGWRPKDDETVLWAKDIDVDAWFIAKGLQHRVRGGSPAAGGPGEVDAADGRKAWGPERRKALLAEFRALEGKRPTEAGKKGKHGALAALVRKSGVDKDTLAAQLDKAIEEKKGADAWAQLTR